MHESLEKEAVYKGFGKKLERKRKEFITF